MWRKQLDALDHRLSPVIVEPVFARLEAGYDQMLSCQRMLGRMLTRRTVTASDVSTLGAPAEMKPPASRRRQAFDTSLATWPRSWIDPAVIFLHFDASFR